MAKDDKRIFVDSNSCLACRACEIACALRHSESGVLERAIAERPGPRTCIVVRQSKGKHAPVQCMQCPRPKCVEACPFDAIFLDPERGVAYKCDLCGGQLACVAACPTCALFYGTREQFRARSAEREPVASGE